MRGFHKILLFISLFLLGLSLISFRADTDDLYWYVEGEPYFWEAQPDVYAFRMRNSSTAKVQLNNEWIDRIQYRSNKDDKIQLVYFKEEISDFDKQAVINEIENLMDFDVSFPVITLFPNFPYDRGMWFVADDRLMANFKTEELDSNSVVNFEIKYNVLAMNRPSENLNPNANFTYIFKIDPTELTYASSIQLARSIYVEESSILENIQPNLINAYEESGTGDEVEVINSIGDDFPASSKTEFYLVNISSNQVKVFCNFPQQKDVLHFNIYDLTGKKLFTKQIDRHSMDFNINLNAYPNGLYVASVENNKGESIEQRKFRKL